MDPASWRPFSFADAEYADSVEAHALRVLVAHPVDIGMSAFAAICDQADMINHVWTARYS
jgi:hypothetical protein